MAFDLLQTELGPLLKRYNSLYNRDIFVKVMRDKTLQEFILDLVRQDQLFEQGIDEDGQVIGYYSEFTESINPEKVAGTHYTLKDSGEFFDSFYIDVFPTYFEINANPIKTNDQGEQENLFYKYGEGIMGLTNESLEKLGQEILRRYLREVKKYLRIT